MSTTNDADPLQSALLEAEQLMNDLSSPSGGGGTGGTGGGGAFSIDSDDDDDDDAATEDVPLNPNHHAVPSNNHTANATAAKESSSTTTTTAATTIVHPLHDDFLHAPPAPPPPQPPQGGSNNNANANFDAFRAQTSKFASNFVSMAKSAANQVAAHAATATTAATASSLSSGGNNNNLGMTMNGGGVGGIGTAGAPFVNSSAVGASRSSPLKQRQPVQQPQPPIVQPATQTQQQQQQQQFQTQQPLQQQQQQQQQREAPFFVELDADQKTALVQRYVGDLLPGEEVIMFLTNLLHVSDSTGFCYNNNVSAATASTTTTIRTTWCCAMSYYRIILFAAHFDCSTKTKVGGGAAATSCSPPPPPSEPCPPDWNAACWPGDKVPYTTRLIQMPVASMARVEKTVFSAGLEMMASSSAAGTATPSSLSNSLMGLTLTGKECGRWVRFCTAVYQDTMGAANALTTYAFPGRRNLGYLFAFESKKRAVMASIVTDPSTGQPRVTLPPAPKRFDAVEEFTRQFQGRRGGGDGGQGQGQGQGGHPWSIWRSVNQSYQTSGSYPSVLCGPASLQVDTNPEAARIVHAAASFRSEGRFPVCTWTSGVDGASVWRASQPKVGLQGNRSQADELLLKHVIESAKSSNALSQQKHKPALSPYTLACLTGCTNQEQLQQYMLPPTCGSGCLKILDMRPRASAMANRTAGYGYENTANYPPGTTLQFCNIGNIHAVRDAYQKMAALHQQGGSPALDAQYGAAVEDTKWYQQVRLILKASWECAFWVHAHRCPVLLHCSHGWDRTGQAACLSQLMLDPYYRTARGFACLVEKDFCSFGHPFHTRSAHGTRTTPSTFSSGGTTSNAASGVGAAASGIMGAAVAGGGGGSGVGVGGGAHGGTVVDAAADLNHRNNNPDVWTADEGQVSPIFVQFLDCAYQLVALYPDCFEFNTKYLLILSEHVYSCRFGTFLCDTEREREQIAAIRQRTGSVWDYLEEPEVMARWKNPNFDSSGTAEGGGGVLLMPLPTLLRNVSVWTDYHARFGAKPTTRWLLPQQHHITNATAQQNCDGTAETYCTLQEMRAQLVLAAAAPQQQRQRQNQQQEQEKQQQPTTTASSATSGSSATAATSPTAQVDGTAAVAITATTTTTTTNIASATASAPADSSAAADSLGKNSNNSNDATTTARTASKPSGSSTAAKPPPQAAAAAVAVDDDQQQRQRDNRQEEEEDHDDSLL